MHFFWYSISSIVCILVLLFPLLTEFNALVATAYNMSLHNHEPPKSERQLHLGDIHHYYSHSYLPFIWQCFGGVYTFFSSCHYLSFLVWTRLNWKGLLGIGVWGCFLLHLFPSPCSQTHLVFDWGGDKRYICIIEFKTLEFLVFVVISEPLVSIYVASSICYPIYYQ